MRGLVFDGAQLTLRHDLPQPVPTGDQVLLKVRRAGICNTDLELVKGYMGFRGILGHEFVAEVVEGPSEWVGRRVVGEINVACGQCDLCLRGMPTQCRNRTTVGIDRHDGAFADYMALTVRNLHAIPDSVSDDAAVFVEPLAAAFQLLESQHISPHDHVVLIGAGKLGLLCAQVLKLSGADVSVVVRRERPTALLAGWGIRAVVLDELPKHRAQVVVDATGTSEGFSSALDLLEPRGTLLLKSTYAGIPQADLTRVVVDEIRVVGSRCGPFPSAIRALERQLVDVAPLIAARYPLDNALDAMQHAAQPAMLKVLLDIADA
jgi:threonine dehydrogenase-like Zn-dependent dehydrogenase